MFLPAIVKDNNMFLPAIVKDNNMFLPAIVKDNNILFNSVKAEIKTSESSMVPAVYPELLRSNAENSSAINDVVLPTIVENEDIVLLIKAATFMDTRVLYDKKYSDKSAILRTDDITYIVGEIDLRAVYIQETSKSESSYEEQTKRHYICSDTSNSESSMVPADYPESLLTLTEDDFMDFSLLKLNDDVKDIHSVILENSSENKDIIGVSYTKTTKIKRFHGIMREVFPSIKYDPRKEFYRREINKEQQRQLPEAIINNDNMILQKIDRYSRIPLKGYDPILAFKDVNDCERYIEEFKIQYNFLSIKEKMDGLCPDLFNTDILIHKSNLRKIEHILLNRDGFISYIEVNLLLIFISGFTCTTWEDYKRQLQLKNFIKNLGEVLFRLYHLYDRTLTEPWSFELIMRDDLISFDKETKLLVQIQQRINNFKKNYSFFNVKQNIVISNHLDNNSINVETGYLLNIENILFNASCFSLDEVNAILKVLEQVKGMTQEGLEKKQLLESFFIDLRNDIFKIDKNVISYCEDNIISLYNKILLGEVSGFDNINMRKKVLDDQKEFILNFKKNYSFFNFKDFVYTFQVLDDFVVLEYKYLSKIERYVKTRYTFSMTEINYFLDLLSKNVRGLTRKHLEKKNLLKSYLKTQKDYLLKIYKDLTILEKSSSSLMEESLYDELYDEFKVKFDIQTDDEMLLIRAIAITKEFKQTYFCLDISNNSNNKSNTIIDLQAEDNYLKKIEKIVAMRDCFTLDEINILLRALDKVNTMKDDKPLFLKTLFLKLEKFILKMKNRPPIFSSTENIDFLLDKLISEGVSDFVYK
jgi:hypothetical protein